MPSSFHPASPLRRLVAPRTLATLLAATLTACGGGGGEGSPPPTTPPATVARVVVAPAQASVVVGRTVTLAAIAENGSGTAMTATIAWSSADATIATVANGVVTGVAPGVATIRASAGSVSGSAQVTVLPVPVATLALTPARDTLFAGVSRQFAALARDSAGATLGNATLAWSSADPAIASVSATGLVTARGAGTTTITVTASSGAKATATMVVKVNPVYPTGYRNFKDAGVEPLSPPLPGGGMYDLLPRGYGDFFGRGNRTDLFNARIIYRIGEAGKEALQSVYTFYRREGNGYVADNAILAPPASTCLHPRKAVVADYNMDGRPDVFIACHGYDAAPFPGEKSQVVLSQPDGRYQVRDATSVGFWHGAGAADLTGDGYPDVVLANNFDPARIVLYVNNGDGSFTRDTGGRLPTIAAGANYFTVELADVDEDGDADLLLGGHEWEGATTRIYLNPGDGRFAGVAPVVIPAVANEGVVLDFLFTGTGPSRTIWITRTSGGDGTFYQSRVLQRFDWVARTAQVVMNDRPASWVPWLIPYTRGGQRYVGSDDPRTPLEYAIP